MTMSLNELKLVIAEILDEAKKKSEKIEKTRKRGAAVEAYGLYDEAFDFSDPLGPFNLYRQQGQANFGPYTAENIPYDGAYHRDNRGATQVHEQAIRQVVRDVIQNGLVPGSSAWAPMLERESANGTWEEAGRLFEAWYDNIKKSSGKDKKKKDKDRPGYGPVQKHGEPKKK
jgi:hypothetical protein